MNRRDFLKGTAAAGAAAVLPLSIFKDAPMERPPRPIQENKFYHIPHGPAISDPKAQVIHNELRKCIESVCNYHMFEPLDKTTFQSMENQIEQFLDTQSIGSGGVSVCQSARKNSGSVYVFTYFRLEGIYYFVDFKFGNCKCPDLWKTSVLERSEQ